MRVGLREAAVITSAVDRAGIADAGFSGHSYVVIEVEADDDVRRPAVAAVLGLDEAHGERPGDLAILVAYEDRAELQAALQARHGSLDGADIAIRDEQIVAARVRGHDDGPRRNRLRDQIGWRGVFLRPAANVAVLVILVGLKVSAIEHDTRQDRYVAAARAVISLQPVPGQQLGGPHES